MEQVADKYVKPDYERVDVIGKDTNKTATGLSHLAICCFWHQVCCSSARLNVCSVLLCWGI